MREMTAGLLTMAHITRTTGIVSLFNDLDLSPTSDQITYTLSNNADSYRFNVLLYFIFVRQKKHDILTLFRQ